MEACKRAKTAKIAFEHLKEVVARAKANLALEGKGREVEAAKAKEELGEAEKKVGEKAVEVYKDLTNIRRRKPGQ